MKKIINEIPIRTTNSFKVNNTVIELDDNIASTYNNYDINKEVNIVVNNDYLVNSKIGLALEGTQLIININKSNDEPIIFNYNFTEHNNLIEEVVVELASNTNAKMIFNYQTNNQEKHVHYLKHQLLLNENSNLNISVINNLNNESTSLIACENEVKEHANLTYNLIDLGGNIKISNVYGITKAFANNSLNVVYLGTNNDLIDTNYYLENNEVESINHINVQGILKDYANKTFKGTIKFISGAKCSIGEEKENTVMLSDEVVSKSAPLLLCDEEDVTGAHASSSGKLDQEKFFYLMSKGLTKKEATKILIEALINPIINNVDDETIVNSITKRISSVL